MNGCFNRAPFKESMKVQDGWIDYGNSRMPRMIDVPFRMSKDCEYQKHDKYNDPNCVGCKHKEAK